MQISRVRRSKSAARKAYDRLSKTYDLLAGTSESQFMRSGLDMLAISEGEIALEIGPGTGKALLEMCIRVGEPGKVYGLDLSPGMLQVAGRRLTRAGVQGRACLLRGDGIALPIKNQAFGVVFLSFTLELFDTPEIPALLAECQRVLKPGGQLGVVAMSKSEQPGIIERLYEWFHASFPAYVDCRPINARAMIQAAGFSLEKWQPGSMWGLPLDVLVARKD